jgi:hypothetical protein
LLLSPSASSPSDTRVRPSLWQVTPSAASEHFGVVRFPNLLSLATSCVSLEPRPLPSLGVTRVQRYYGPLRHPIAPGLSLAGFRLVVRPTTPWGFPCCRGLPLIDMPSPLPRRNNRLLVSLASPVMTAFPETQAGRLPHHPFWGLLSVYLRYGLSVRQVTK